MEVEDSRSVEVVACDGASVNSPLPPYSGADLDRVAAIMDRMSEAPSRMRRFEETETLLFTSAPPGPPAAACETQSHAEHESRNSAEPSGDPDTRTLPLLEAAAWAAIRYSTEFVVEGDRERARMRPHFVASDGTDPPEIKDVSEATRNAWVDLAGAVSKAPARALFSHLSFETGALNARQHAQDAADAYLEVGASEERTSDRVHAARVALRLARAVGDQSRRARSVDMLHDVCIVAISSPNRSVGAAREALGTLIREKADSARQLVQLACDSWAGEQPADTFWQLKLATATDDADRQQIWRDRLDGALALAESSSPNILRATRLHQAMIIAEQSGISELRERASVLVQEIRNLDLGMITFTASTYQFEERIEEAIASVLTDRAAADVIAGGQADRLELLTSHNPTEHEGRDADSSPPRVWTHRLNGFANYPAPTGDPDSNREHVARQQELAPLQALFGTTLLTPEGLPLYTPANDEERFELDLVRWETDLLQQWTPILAEALHRVAAPKLPPFDELAEFLNTGPASSEIVGRLLAESFYRYWSGDGKGSIFTTVPLLETLVRNSILAADRGIYRLQKKQSPGQYVGLGILLDLFEDSYGVGTRDARFFRALLKHPGGLNLRNLLAHGYLPDASGNFGAVVLYAALRIIVLTTVPNQQTEPAPAR